MRHFQVQFYFEIEKIKKEERSGYLFYICQFQDKIECRFYSPEHYPSLAIYIHILSKMPKTVITKKNRKSPSAVRQSSQYIKRAAEGDKTLSFLSVQAARGNGYFSLRRADGREILGTPRGLFSRGSMRISVGQIVVVEGIPGDPSKILTCPYEIMGVIQERDLAIELVESGRMSKEVLIAATMAGSMADTTMADTLADIFEGSEEEEEEETQKRVRKDKKRGGGSDDIPDEDL